MLSNLCVVSSASASRIAWLKYPGSYCIWNIIWTIADMYSFLPRFCIILFYVSAEPRPLDAEHLLHYNYQHGHAVQLITAGNVRIWSSSQAGWALSSHSAWSGPTHSLYTEWNGSAGGAGHGGVLPEAGEHAVSIHHTAGWCWLQCRGCVDGGCSYQGKDRGLLHQGWIFSSSLGREQFSLSVSRCGSAESVGRSTVTTPTQQF